MASGLGAGAGADMLQDILRQKFAEAIQREHLTRARQQMEQQAAHQAQMLALQQRTADRADEQSGILNAQRIAGMAKDESAAATAGHQNRLRASIQGSQNLAGSGDPSGALATRQALRVALASSGAQGKDIPQEPEPEKPTAAPRPVSVAPGSRLVDPVTGKVVFASPDRPRETPTVVIQTVDENGNAVRKIVPKTAGAEYAATPRQKLSVGQQEDLATMDTVQKLSDEATKLGAQIGWKGVGGLGQGTVGQLAMRHLGAGDPRAEELRNFVGNIQGTIAKLRGGTAFSAQEKAMLDSYTPTINDSPQAIQAKLKSLNVFIAAKRESTMKFAGAGVAPQKGGGDPLGIR